MLFNSPQFVLFFLAVLACYWSAPARTRNGLLLAASWLFYLSWVPVYLLLFLASLGVNYLLLRALLARPGRRGLLAVVCVVDLGLLASFKYAGFLVATAAPALDALIGIHPAAPDLLLPLGISFYTFQMLALAIDAYRGRAEPVPGFARYALYISFFPQLIAGPILRGAELLPQLARGGRLALGSVRAGLRLVVWGLTKKVVFGDFLLAPFVDRIHGLPEAATGPDLWVVAWAFAFQIYFDFSGYTDIARGLARLLGFELPENFREPFLSRNPVEFWRRWHITLSQWLRDYLYIPLGGNRGGPARTQLNLFLTLLIGGLWHGAGWTFVLWGALHGAWLVGHRLLVRRFAGGRAARSEDAPLRWRDAPRIFVCFNLVALFFVAFRAEGLGPLQEIYGGLLSTDPSDPWPILPTLVVAVCFGIHAAERALRVHGDRLLVRIAPAWGGALEGAVLGALTALVVLLGAAATGEFIYFQF